MPWSQPARWLRRKALPVFLNHTPPQHAETVARAVVGACRVDGWAAPTQPKLLRTLFHDLMGHDFDFETLEPNTPGEAAAALRSAEERQELVQLMCAIEVLSESMLERTEESVATWARALDVPERGLVVLRDLAAGEFRKMLEDFYRLNWIGDLSRRESGFGRLLELGGEEAYAQTVEPDPKKAARYQNLATCPEGSLGRYLYEFYQKRGFGFPGEEGAASEAVAHHDWIHLLSDYGTTPLGEIEVVSFMTTCTRTPGAMLGLIGALALFESGVMREGFVTGSTPHQGLSRPGGIDRMSEAIARGKACSTDLLLDVDYFTMADEPLVDLRERFDIPTKSPTVQSLDPWGALEVEPAT
ncbi:MAG: hypothetical protein AAF436_07425 [Myxococcota bacterium]